MLQQLAEQLDRLHHGDHVCLLYEDSLELVASAAPFIKGGLERGEACLGLVSESSSKGIALWLEDAGVDVAIAVKRGQLIFMTAQDWSPESLSDTGAMEKAAWEMVEWSKSNGFAGVRAVFEMGCVLGFESVRSNIAEREAVWDALIEKAPVTALCAYHYRRLEPEVAHGALRTHSLVVMGGRLGPNPYHETPQMVLNKETQARKVDWMVQQLLAMRQAEEELRRSQEHLKFILETADIGTWEWDVSTGEVRWSEKLEAMFGLPLGSFPGTFQAFQELIFPEDKERVLEAIRRAVEEGAEYHLEYRTQGADGVVRWTEARGKVIRNVGGKMVQMVGICMNIDGRKQMEQALQRREREFEALTDSLPAIIGRFDRDLRCVYINRAIQDMTGLPRESYIGKTHKELGMPPETAQAMQEGVQEVFKTGQPTLVVHEVDTPGGKRYFQVRRVPELGEDGSIQHVLSISFDITEHVLVEKAIREGDEKYRSLVESMDAIVWEADARTLQFTFVSKQAEAITGYPVEQWVEEVDFWSNHIHPDDRQWAVRYCLDHTRLGEDHAFDYRFISADGQTIWFHDVVRVIKDDRGRPRWMRGVMVDVTERKRMEEGLALYREIFTNANDAILVLDNQGRIVSQNPANRELFGFSDEEMMGKTPAMLLGDDAFGQIVNTIAAQGYFRGEVRSITKSGDWKDVEVSAFVVKGADGKPIRYVGFKRDVTEKKQAQEREHLARLHFLRALAHEVRNPLTAMLSSAGLLKDLSDEAGDKAKVRLLNNMISGAEILRARIEDFLDVAAYEAGKFTLDKREIDPGEVLKGLCEFLRPQAMEKRQRLVLRLPEAIPPIRADQRRFRQVVENLLSNAMKFSPEGTTITIGTQAKGRWIVFEVADQGEGISEEEQRRLFQPYFRTEQDRHKSHGLGIGLALCKQIVEAHGGRIWVKSRVGEGSTFYFTLPRASDEG